MVVSVHSHAVLPWLWRVDLAMLYQRVKPSSRAISWHRVSRSQPAKQLLLGSPWRPLLRQRPL